MNPKRTHIRGATLVHPTGLLEADVAIEDGRIVAIGGALGGCAVEEIDATGLHLFPGVIDPHVHFRDPGLPHKEDLRSGSAAAVIGGVTAFLDMPNTVPPAIDQEQIDRKLSRAKGRSYAHYGFFIGASNDNLEALKAAKRVPGIKIFVGSSTGNMLVDDQRVLEAIFENTTLPIAAHCEEERLVQANFQRFAAETDPATHSRVRTPEAAARSVERMVKIARNSGHRFHVVHVSTRAELEVLPRDIAHITFEVCIPHLFLDTTDYERLNNFAKVNPALRQPADREAAWQALREGRFSLVATDHAPHTASEKKRPYPEAPSGIPSVENSFALMLDAAHRGLLPLTDVSRYMCAGPADVWQMANKGQIEVGFDADLVLVDLSKRATIDSAKQNTRAGWSPWHGRELTGWPVRTLIAGTTVAQNGAIVAEPNGQPLRFRS